jgi:hypothetical protein
MLKQQAKKYIELRWEYVEQIPSLVSVACFLPRRTKDLSDSPRNSATLVEKGHLLALEFLRTAVHYLLLGLL